MAKILELESSGTDPIPTETKQDNMTDTEKVIQVFHFLLATEDRCQTTNKNIL